MSILIRVGTVIGIWYAILLPLRVLTLRRAIQPWIPGAAGLVLGLSASLAAVVGRGSVPAGAAVVIAYGLIGLAAGVLIGRRVTLGGNASRS